MGSLPKITGSWTHFKRVMETPGPRHVCRVGAVVFSRFRSFLLASASATQSQAPRGFFMPRPPQLGLGIPIGSNPVDEPLFAGAPRRTACKTAAKPDAKRPRASAATLFEGGGGGFGKGVLSPKGRKRRFLT